MALANAANIISNRFVLPYTSGSVCNKSSVAAMLGVMDNVAPYQGENEFPDDIPFDTYFGEQKRRAEEMARAAAEYAAAQQQNDYGNTIEYEEPAYTEDEYGQPVAPEGEQGEAFDEQIDGFEGASADETLIGVIAPGSQVQDIPAEEPVADESAAESAEEPAAAEQAEPEPKLYRNAAGNIRFGSDAIRALGMLPESCTLDYEEGEEPTSSPRPSPIRSWLRSPMSQCRRDGSRCGDCYRSRSPVWTSWRLPRRPRSSIIPRTTTMRIRSVCPTRATPIFLPSFR